MCFPTPSLVCLLFVAVIDTLTLISLSTTTSENYFFNLPITCELWYRRSGARCVVQILAVSNADLASERTQLVMRTLRASEALFRLHAYVVHAPAPTSTPLSQLARLYVSLFDDFDALPDALITTADVDMWPVDTNFSLPDRSMPRNFVKVADAHCCSEWSPSANGRYAAVREVAMHGVTTSAARWRVLLGFETFGQRPIAANSTGGYKQFLDDILRQHRLLFNFDPVKHKITHGSALWNMDQRRISGILSALPLTDIVRMRRRPEQRLESHWPITRFGAHTIDIHIYASHFSALRGWTRNRELLVQLLPVASVVNIDAFVAAWRTIG